MRFFHLADLHIGKRLREFSLLADQEDILEKILGLVAQYRPHAILICGDIYDKPDPSAEAVELFDKFLTRLAQYNQPVMIISGNHDSPERINYGSSIMAGQQVYLAGVFAGQMQSVTLNDEYGDIEFHLLPFIKPAHVRRYYPEANIISYEDALRAVLSSAPLAPEKRHILLAHQFITAQGHIPERSDSEQISIGTLDNIDASVFNGFDYVALGHIHRPQSIGGNHIRYAGSPLKYSFSEALHHKAVTLVEIKEHANIAIELLPLIPRRDLREIRGPIEKLLSPDVYLAADRNDYLHITLTDEEDLVDPLVALRNIYPHIVSLDFDNSRYAAADNDASITNIDAKSPPELFAEFYALQQNIDLDESKKAIVQKIFQELEDKR